MKAKNILERLDELTQPNYKGDLYLNEEDYAFIMSKEIGIEDAVKKTGIRNAFEYEGVYLGFVLNAMPIYRSDTGYSYIKFADKII
jgi:PDZ domain-containing secreted protein